MTPENEPPGRQVSKMLLGKRGEIASERVKRLGRSRNASCICADAVVHASGGESEVQCYKEQNCAGAWNAGSMNQDKLEVVKMLMFILGTVI